MKDGTATNIKQALQKVLEAAGIKAFSFKRRKHKLAETDPQKNAVRTKRTQKTSAWN